MIIIIFQILFSVKSITTLNITNTINMNIDMFKIGE